MKTKFDSFSGANEIVYNNEETEFDNGSRILTDPRGEADMVDHVRMGHLLYAVAKNNPQLDIDDSIMEIEITLNQLDELIDAIKNFEVKGKENPNN